MVVQHTIVVAHVVVKHIIVVLTQNVEYHHTRHVEHQAAAVKHIKEVLQHVVVKLGDHLDHGQTQAHVLQEKVVTMAL